VLRAALPHLGADGAYTVVLGDSATWPVPGSGLVSMEQAALPRQGRLPCPRRRGRIRFQELCELVRVAYDPAAAPLIDEVGLDGLIYSGLPLIVSTDGKRKDPNLRVWRDLLSKHTTSYAAQPWQHLAAAHRAAGHEKFAKRLLIDQQDDRRDRVIRGDDDRPHPWTWVRRNVLMRGSKAFTGYGYKTSWTLLWLLGWAGVGVGVSLSTQLVETQTTYVKTGEDTARTEQLPAAVHGRLTADAGGHCSPGELVGLGLEWALPIVKTGASTSCVLNTTDPAGQWMSAASWGVQAGGWALATLVIAGYTGIVRRL